MFENKDVKVLLAVAGSGKLEWVEQIIPTPIGFRRFGDLKVGDYVYNAEGYPTMVLGIYPQGYTDVYKVTLSDGRSTECGLEHLWGIYSRTGHKNNEWKYEVLELKEMLRRGIRGKDKRKNRTLGNPKFYIPASPVIKGEEKNLPCNPYILGSFIGNGCCTLRFLTLSSNDTWQVDKCASILGCKVKQNKCNFSWNFVKEGHLVKTQNIIPSELVCYANEKSIPSAYMFSSVEQRKALLQGLFDTDGSISTNSGRLHISYSTSSKKLCEDVRDLLLTFGIASSVREDKRSKNINYNISINCSKEKAKFLFSLPRKLDKVLSFNKKQHRDYTKVAIRSVEKLPVKKETMCIYVGNEKHLYLTKDFIVTHNTSTLVKYIEEELKTRRPEEIAFVTFTKKGADEGLRRVCDKFCLTPEDLPYFRTLHSLTFHALNLKVNQVFSALDQKEFNKTYGYYVNRVEVNKGKAHPTKDSLYLDYYDLERSNALTSKQIAESDIDVGYYRSLVRKYEDFKASKCAVDFFDCLIKYVQEGDSLPCKVVMIDEAQDITALQWKVIEKAFKNAEKVYIAGDDKQCQPSGSKVLTKKGYKNIEDITEEDSLITFAQEDYAYYGLRQAEYHPEVAHRHYTGKLIDVEINGTVNRFTPSHKMIVRWLNRDTSLYCVYLMRKGKKFRIGQCKIFNSNGTMHFIVRMNGEQAEEGWFLRICKTKKEALVWEQVYSLNYGIPQISWKFWHTQAMQEEVYNFLPCLEAKAEKLLEEVGRNINYPMFNHKKNNAKSGGTCISLCEAINLVPEIMVLPVYQGKSHADKNTLWQNFTTREENFSGFVYSMNVPKYHTYVTEGGLTVHNCIYKYSGARPDILIQLSKQYPVEHLTKSYRTPLSVYRLANAITEFIGEKTEQKSEPRTENGEGSITQLSDTDRLAKIITPVLENKNESSWFILARNKCFLNRATESLEDNLIPYWTVDGFFMGGEVMKRLTDYESFKLEGYKSEEKRQQFAQKFGITDFSVPFTSTNLFTEGRKWVYASYIEKYGLDFLKEMCKWKPQILVSTIHAQKGAEADNVAVLLDATRKTKRNVFEDIDEELRCLYVAVTRTKKNLYFIDSQDSKGYDDVITTLKNQFCLDF